MNLIGLTWDSYTIQSLLGSWNRVEIFLHVLASLNSGLASLYSRYYSRYYRWGSSLRVLSALATHVDPQSLILYLGFQSWKAQDESERSLLKGPSALQGSVIFRPGDHEGVVRGSTA